MKRTVLGLSVGCMLALTLVAGCTSDPSTSKHWAKRIGEGKSKKDRLRAVEDLRSSKYMSRAMVPTLTQRLGAEKSAEVKAALARLLGETGDGSAVDALIDAVDPAASDSEARGMNKEIAIALGGLKDAKAVPALMRLLKVRGDNYTLIAAIEALGDLKAKQAFEPLYEIATNEEIEPFITKKAVMALGDIGDPRAIPGIVKLMFKERKGISFYMESSFALYQFGSPAADALLPVVEERDKSLFAWAEEKNIQKVALLAKAAQVLGDLHDLRAEKALIGFLGFQSEFDDIRLIMQMRAADALGRMRSAAAVKALAAVTVEPEPSARRETVWALARIGGKQALPKLLESAAVGTWDAREESIRGLAMLSDDPGVFTKLAAAEAKLFERQCQEDDSARDCADVAGGVKKHLERIGAFQRRAEAAQQCKDDAACWVAKLGDSDDGIRERAAYELGRSGQASVVGELMKRLTEKNLDARLAFIQGADWLVHDSKEAMAEAQKALPELEKQLAQEKGKSEYAKVNEDLRRLYVKVKRG